MKWLEFAKAHKEVWGMLDLGPKGGDMPPYVVAEQDGEPLLIVLAPQIDKHLALNAAVVCRKGLCCDAVTVITDGYHLIPKEGETAETFEERHRAIREKYEWLQDAFLDGCKDVGEAITAIRCDVEGHVIVANNYYVREDKTITWTEEPTVLDSKQDGAQIGGFIPDALRQIMNEPPLWDDEELRIQAEAAGCDVDSMDPRKRLWHTSRAVRQALHMKDYILMEAIRWNPQEGYGELIRKTQELYSQLEGLYDFEHMRTQDAFWRQWRRSDS
jgi:hypothetical protein